MTGHDALSGEEISQTHRAHVCLQTRRLNWERCASRAAEASQLARIERETDGAVPAA